MFCADTRLMRSQKDFDLKSILSVLKENRKKFNSLIITGGEPTIYKKLLQVIKYSKQICRYERILLVTNGSLLANQKFTDSLISAGVDSFQISYFAPTEKLHDAISRTKHTFEPLNKGIELVVKRKKEARINLVINKLNYKYLPQITADLIRKKVNSITLAQMNPVGESMMGDRSVLVVEYEKIIPFIVESFKIAKQLKYNNLLIENFPICIVEEYQQFLSDLKQPDENGDYYDSFKAKTNKCVDCGYKRRCKGVWKSYLTQFGDAIISPRLALRSVTTSVKINNKCNADCVFCDTPVEAKFLDDPSFKIKCEEIKNKRKNKIGLSIVGGEPTIYPKLTDFVRYAKKTCKYENIDIVSNGLKYSDAQFVDELIDAGVDCFTISFNTINPEVYDKIVRRKDSFKKVSKGMDNIKKRNKNIAINTVVHKYNYLDLPEIVEFLINKKVDGIMLSSFNPVCPILEDGKAEVAITFTQVLPKVEEAIAVAKRMNYKFLKLHSFFPCLIKNHLDLWLPCVDIPEELVKKIDECGKCAYESRCDGVWKAYLDQFGDSEFKAVTKEDLLIKKQQ